MTSEEYTQTADMLSIFLEGLESLDLEGVKAIHGQAEAIGPLFHPTEYMQGGHENLRDMGAILGPAIELQKVWAAVKEGRKKL